MALLRTFDGNVPGVSQDSNIRGVFLNNFLAECPILQYLQWYPMTGSSDAPVKPATAVGGGVRAINADFANNRTAPDFGAVVLKIFGDKIETDKEYQARFQDLGGEHLRQLISFAKAMGRDFMDRLVNDTTSSTTWDGLKALVPNTAEAWIHLGGANGDTVPLGNDNTSKLKQQQFVEALDEMAERSDFLLMNSLMRNRARSIGRDRITSTDMTNAVGKRITLDAWNGTPIVLAGKNKTKSAQVITTTETCGTSEGVCTSIYGVKTAEKENLSLATNVGVRVEGPVQEANFLVTRVNLSAGLLLLDDQSLIRMDGIKLAA